MNYTVLRVHCFCDISHVKAEVTEVQKYTAAIQPPAPKMSGMVMNRSMVEVMKYLNSVSDTIIKRCTGFNIGSLR